MHKLTPEEKYEIDFCIENIDQDALEKILFPNRFIYRLTFEHSTNEKSHYLPPQFIKEIEEVSYKYQLKLCSIMEDSNV